MAEDLLKWPLWARLLPQLDGKYLMELDIVRQGTYSHMVKISKQFLKAGLVTRMKKGRCVVFNLTKKGRKVADNLIAAMGTMQKWS